ncbi:MAG TPA: DUF4232 domain-containing protein [Terriglobales bacterium]|nr:DUF4232 domain-containing protein [Terriglobales bacterium]
MSGHKAIAFLFALLAATASWSSDQTQPKATDDCTASELDASFKFMNQAPADQVVAINFRNISEHACVLRGGSGAMFDDFTHGHNIWAKECRNCTSDGKQRLVPPLTLDVGEIGHFVLRWNKKSVDQGSCLESDGLNTNLNGSSSYLIVAPSLLTNVCSVVSEDSYLPGPYPGAASNDQAPDRDTTYA